MSLVNAVINQNQYILAPSLQMFFIDPSNCQPLSAGTVTFYSDTDRTPSGLKPVYRIGGTPTDPTFTALPNPVTLDMCGIFIDNNNGDIVLPYYDVLDDNGDVDLYYIVIADQYGNVIETLEHFPQVDDQGQNTVTQLNNIFPNGQFLEHLNLPDNGVIPNTDQYTAIAYGGWSFAQTAASSSINIVTFPRYDSPIENPEQNPRYSVELQCTNANPSDSQKDIYNLITDVNFMQGQDLTFQVTAYSNDGVPHNVSLIIYKNYGTAGSSPEETVISTFTVTTEIQKFNIPFTMPSNEGKTLGTSDNDYIQVIVRSPIDTVSDIIYTDFILVPGTLTALTYPPTSPEIDKAFTIPASFSIPNYSGSDNNKFVQLSTTSLNGQPLLSFTYANPVLTGSHQWYTGRFAPEGYLLEDGKAYAVEVNDDNTIDGYPELFAVIQENQENDSHVFSFLPYAYGSGQNGFRNTFFSPNTIAQTWNRNDVAQPAPDAGTSGFTISVITPGIVGVYQVIHVTPLPGNLITPGSYYRLIVNTIGPQFIQLFWFSIDGVGTIPNVTYDVAVHIALSAGQSDADVANTLAYEANGLFQVPDVRGYFIRGWDAASGHDPDAVNRTASGAEPATAASGNTGDHVGSYQADQNLSHNHPGSYWDYGTLGLQAGGGTVYQYNAPPNNQGAIVIAFDGGLQSNPRNLYFNGIIKT